MRVHVGNGWSIVHLTDRVIELTKDDYVYRRITGADGFVRVRAEPGFNRNDLVNRAIQQTQRCDEDLSYRLAADVFPSARGSAQYRDKLRALRAKFETPEDSRIIGVKRA